MGTVIAGAVLGLFIGIIICICYRQVLFGALVIGSSVGAIVGLIVWGIVLLSAPIAYETVEIEYTHNMGNLNRENSISGAFFLGTGFVNSAPIYTYYHDQGDNVYRLNIVRSSGNVVLVYEEDREDGELIVYNSTMHRSIERFFFQWGRFSGAKFYTFHIPKGSIVNNFVP
jgi:hypothetical protein